ncbi:hypothetical protein QZH41_001710 [Actinostola sp. cb2023]|nr:hypothetical protein QZH41_001710 [Actinostola sp. cb2023]
MGGIISSIRDVKVILRDLKITLKFTAKIVLKVHGIVDDMEQTMQELKETVNGLSSRLPKSASQENILDEASTATYVDEMVHTIETKAESVRASLSSAVAVLTSDDLITNTSSAWENLVGHKNLTDVMSKWASVPDGIGDLVKQDCERLAEYFHCPENSPSKAGATVEPKWPEKPDTDKPDMKPTMEICQLISTTAIPKTVHILCEHQLIHKGEVPEIVIEEILTQGIDTERLLKLIRPSKTCKVHYDPKWLSTLLKTNPQRTRQHKSNGNSLLCELDGNTGDIKTAGEIQTELLSLVLLSFLQGFLKNEVPAGGCKAISAENVTRYLACD